MIRLAALAMAGAVLGAASLSRPAVAAEPPPGATTCSGCHGHGGMIAINGRDLKAMDAEMEAFRSGARPATLMNRIVKGFSPEQVDAISQWLATQK